QVKAERIERLIELETELRDNYHRTLLGRELSVLIEAELPGNIFAGTSCRYAPVEIQTGRGRESLASANSPLDTISPAKDSRLPDAAQPVDTAPRLTPFHLATVTPTSLESGRLIAPFPSPFGRGLG